MIQFDSGHGDAVPLPRIVADRGKGTVRKEWEADQLIEQWTLLEDDHALLANKTGPTRLGFAVLLKFFQIEGRFPERSEDLPAVAIDYVARQLGIAASAFRNYSWSGR